MLEIFQLLSRVKPLLGEILTVWTKTNLIQSRCSQQCPGFSLKNYATVGNPVLSDFKSTCYHLPFSHPECLFLILVIVFTLTVFQSWNLWNTRFASNVSLSMSKTEHITRKKERISTKCLLSLIFPKCLWIE